MLLQCLGPDVSHRLTEPSLPRAMDVKALAALRACKLALIHLHSTDGTCRGLPSSKGLGVDVWQGCFEGSLTHV